VICDDFLAEDVNGLPRHSSAWRTIERFTIGWHAANLNIAARAIESAATHGLRLVECRDLSPYMRPFHPLVLHALLAVTRLPLPWAYWHNLSGGSALQVCLQNGWTRYLVLVFEKEGVCTPSP